MTLVLRVFLAVFSLILIIATTLVLRKGSIPIKYSLLWYFCAIIIFMVAVFPFTMEYIKAIIGFKTISNLVVGIIIALLLFLTMSLTIIMSGQQKKITLLIQEVSTLKSKIEKK